MRLPIIAAFGLVGGATIALGRMSAEQLHAAGQALLTLAAAHWPIVLPWLLAALFAWLWWRARSTSNELERVATDALRIAHRSQEIAKSVYRDAPKQRKRATR